MAWAHAWMADSELLVAVTRPGVREAYDVMQAHRRTYPQPGDWNTAYAEITRLRRDLRATEDQLAEQRRLNDQLRADSDRKLAHEQGRVKALIVQVRILDSLRKPVTIPAQAVDFCDPSPVPAKPTVAAGSIDTWEDA